LGYENQTRKTFVEGIRLGSRKRARSRGDSHGIFGSIYKEGIH